jgi:DNA primase small subunit
VSYVFLLLKRQCAQISSWLLLPLSARKLTDEQRSSIANYFAVYKGYENDKAKLALGAGGPTLHPAVQEAVDLLMPNWEAVRMKLQ